MYRRKIVEQVTKIPARRIQFYSDSGLLHLAEVNPGRGNERLYSKKNLLELLIVAELSKYKIGLSEIKRILVDVVGGQSGDVLSIILDASEDSGTYFLYFLDGNAFFGHGKIDKDSPFKIPAAWGSSMENITSTFFINLSKLAKRLKSI